MNLTEIKEAIYFSSPTFIQNFLISQYGKNLYKKRYSTPFQVLLNQIYDAEDMSRENVDALQFTRLKTILNEAYLHVPYYQRLFHEHGLLPDNFGDLSDLEKLPILDKEIYRNNSEKFLSKNPARQTYLHQNTSGSTGSPLSIPLDEETYKFAMALLVYHENINGIEFGERRATFAGRMIQKLSDNSGPFYRYNSSENQYLFSSYHINDDNIKIYIESLNKIRPAELIGYPSSLYNLAACLSSAGLKPDFQPKLIVTNSETLLIWQKEFIEDVFSCEIRDYYGTAEYLVFASQCGYANYHINPNLGIVECVDEYGKSVVDIEGDIICTTLTNFSMPLLRYRIGDRGILSSELCSCGRQTKILSKIVGRTDDYVICQDNTKIGRMDHIYKGLNGIKESQIIQHKDRSCTIKLVKSSSDIKLNESKLLQNFHSRTGNSLKVKIKYVEKIARGNNGKFRAVINEMNS